MLNNIREWISDNLRYILLGLAAVLVIVIVVCVIRLTRPSSNDKRPDTGTQNPVKVETEKSTEKKTAQTEAKNDDGGQSAAPSTDRTVANSAELVKDDSAVLTLVRDYYSALADRDGEKLSTMVDPWNVQVESETLNQETIESYNNIATYSKTGRDQGDVLVLSYYEAKLPNVDTLSPTLVVLYLRQDNNGDLKVYPYRVVDKEIEDYITLVCKDEDVQTLMTDIEAKYKTAVSSDEKLKEYVDNRGTDTSSPEQEAETGKEDASAQSGVTMTAIADLNIREEPSTEAAIMGVLTTGEYVTVLAEAEDGWVQISYDGGNYTLEGYVKAEFLEKQSAAANGNDAV